MSLRRFRKGDKLPADLSKVPERIELKVYEAYDGWRVDRYLAEHIPWRSRTQIQERIKAGVVCKNGSVVPTGNRRVRFGDLVTVEVPPPKEDLSALEEIELPLLYEDAWFIGVDKPPNLLVHPVGERRFTSVINILHRMYRNTEDPRKDVVPMLGHRLDAETTGVLLCTKSKRAKGLVTKAIMRRDTVKRYVALVEGHLAEPAALIDMPLGPRPEHEITLSRGIDLEHGQPAQSVYRVAQRLPGFDLVEVQLITGRQHQIRVHFEALGHPLVGDPLYGVRRTLTRREAREAGERDIAASTVARRAEPAQTPPMAELFEVRESLPQLSAPNPQWRARRTMVPAEGPDPWHDDTEEAFLATGTRAKPIQRPLGFPTDPEVLLDRVALHSAELILDHPFEPRPLQLVAPLPQDLAAAVAELQGFWS